MTIKTWQERAEVDPWGTQLALMQAEIDELRAALEVWEQQEPVCYGHRGKDGLILDVIHPDEHESYEGSYTVPLYPKPKDKL